MTPDEHIPFIRIAIAAQSLLDRLDTITTTEFSTGGEKVEREHLRQMLAQLEPLRQTGAR